ncbi:MAG: branched-chain amino acid ABC transporter permease [Alphaproteobacteria bacterium]|nr:branched-chain amino acid ABC transporter permease [Alphaproteobacteria bacterium]
MTLDAAVLQLAVNGAAVGAIYALVALGLVMTYKATEVLNFAYGDVLMLSAFIGWYASASLGLPFWAAALVAVGAAAALSYVIDAGVMRRIAGQPHFSAVMLTIAVSFMLRGLAGMVFGPTSRRLETPWSGQTSRFSGVVVADISLAIIATASVVTAVLFVVLRTTRYGIGIQAASQNQLAAYLCGIRVKRLNSLVWAVSGAIAAASGVLLAPLALVDISLWGVVLKGFAALVLGGFGSMPGAVVGGVSIGLIEQFAGVYLPDGFKDVSAQLVLILVLLCFPRGLLGEAHGRRV